MIRIGVTGQRGFIGQHLVRYLKLFPDKFQLIPFEKDCFNNEDKLNEFVKRCDTIVHLAAMNRHENSNVIYDTNIELVERLIEAFRATNSRPHVLVSSSTQEQRNNLYGKSKKVGREALMKWAKEVGAVFTGLIIPNVFGPFGKPFYNSVIATFCYQLTHGEQPEVHQDGDLDLIYVDNLSKKIIFYIENRVNEPICFVPKDGSIKVSGILHKLRYFRNTYFEKGEIPELEDSFTHNLFNTYRCYIDMGQHFPVKLTKHVDERGGFVEVIRLGIGGQASFSTTVPGITRGNHYHTRKIERFAVIKGKANIKMRKVGTNKIMVFNLDGEDPSYVDIPVWFTHSITNIGNEELYTVFWINEPYDPNNADTYFEKVEINQ